MEDTAAGTFSLRRFYERRARRLLPALFAVMAISTIIAAALFIGPDFRKFAQALAASALFGSNLLFARKVGYFDDDEGFAPLLHLWSLSVEEQFYLLFPLGLAWLLRKRPTWLLPAMVATFALSLALAVAIIPRDPQAAFFLLPTRAWELMTGAACAVLVRQLSPHEMPAMAGLALILLGFAVIDPATPAPGLVFLLPTLGAALVIVFATPGTLSGQLLSPAPLTAVGAASYGIYLWHNPLLAFMRYVWFGDIPWPLTAAVIGLSIALGFASLHLIERPVRSGARLASRRALLVFSFAGVALAAGLGAAVHLRLMPSNEPGHAGALVDPVVTPDGPLAFALFGDSHARQYYTAMSARFGKGALLSESSCLSLPGVSDMLPDDPASADCTTLSDRLVALVKARHIRTIYWAQRWERELYAIRDGTPIGSTSGKGEAAMLDGIRRLARALPPGTRIVLIGNVPTALAAGPEMAGGYPRCRAYLNVTCPQSYPDARAEARSVNLALAKLTQSSPDFAWADPSESLCAVGRCRIVDGVGLIYADHTHLTPPAARQVVARLPSPAI